MAAPPSFFYSTCVTFYTWCNPIAVTCTLYSNPKRTATVGAGYYSDGVNVYQTNSSGVIIAISSCANCPVADTFITSFCSGYDLYYTYTDGNCGTYNTLIESNSATCGYTQSYPYSCDCGGGCAGYNDPCYVIGCPDCYDQQ